MSVNIRVDGLRELEARLKVLREELGVKTGGVIIRGLKDGMREVVAEAKRRAPKRDRSGFLVARKARQQAERLARTGKYKRAKGELTKSLALIRQNIVSYPIPTSSAAAGGKPTVIMRVRARGYERAERSIRKGKSGKLPIRFLSPGTSPGYWWFEEFGTSNFAARPFMRPAFKAKKEVALERMRKHIKEEIHRIVSKRHAKIFK